MSTLGGADLMRGYFEGRYRDKMYTTLCAEYRFPLAYFFRGTLFANAGDVYPQLKSFSISDVKYSYGAGIRMMLTKSGMSLRFDVATTPQGTTSYYIAINEAF